MLHTIDKLKEHLNDKIAVQGYIEAEPDLLCIIPQFYLLIKRHVKF